MSLLLLIYQLFLVSEWLSTAPTLDFFPFEETCDPSLGAQPVQAKRKRGRPRKSVVNNIVGDVEPDKDENRSGRSRLDKQKRFKDQRPATDQDVALDGRRGDGGRLRPMKSRASNELGSSHSSRAKIQRVNPVRKSGVGKDRVLVDRLPGRKTQMQEDSVGSKISKSDGRKNERERSQEVRRQKNVKINGTIGSLEVRAPNVDPPSRERERSQKIGQLVRQKHCEGDMGTNKRMLRPRPSPGGVGNETKQRVNSKQKLGNPTKSGYGKGKSQEIGRIEQTERKMPSNERIMGLRRLAPEVYSSDPLPAPDKTKPKLLVGKVKRSKKNVQNMTNVDVRAVGDWLRPRSSLSQKRGHSPQLVSKGCEGMSTNLVPPSTSQQVKRKRGRPRKTVPVTMEDIAIGETTGDGGQLLQQEKPGESSKRENECVNPLRINKDMDVEHRIFDLEQLNEHSESLRVQDVYEPKESLIIGSVKSVSLAERSTMTAEVGQSPNAENLRSFQEEETYEDGITDDGLKSQSNYCEVIEVVRKHQGPFQEEETHEGGMADDGLKSQSNYCEVIKVVRKHQGSSPVGTEGDRAPVKDEQWLRQLERPIKCEISNLQPDQEDLEYVQPANSSMGETEEHSFVEGSHVLETVKLQIDQSSSHQANFPRSDLAKIQEVKVEQGIVEYGLFTGLVDEDIGHLQQKNQCCSPPSTGETAGSCNGSSASCFP